MIIMIFSDQMYFFLLFSSSTCGAAWLHGRWYKRKVRGRLIRARNAWQSNHDTKVSHLISRQGRRETYHTPITWYWKCILNCIKPIHPSLWVFNTSVCTAISLFARFKQPEKVPKIKIMLISENKEIHNSRIRSFNCQWVVAVFYTL